MVRYEKLNTKMRSTYYLKPGQTLENTKIADRSMALMVSKRDFNRFVDYTTENERLAAAAQEEAAKLAALKKATYEMSKTWDDTIANIQKRRREDLLSRKQREDDARAQFIKDLKARNAAERAEIVKEARKLLLWKKPQCRLINGALLTSECYRQLDAQLAFEKTLRGIDKERDKEYAKFIKEEAENAAKEEKKKAEERIKKNRAYGEELKNQIEGVGNEFKRLELQELEMEKQDLKNMVKEIRMIEECEAEQTLKRKKELNKMFIDAVEEKKLHELKVKQNDEFENRALEVFAKSKDRIKKIGKIKMKEARDERERHSESIARRCAAFQQSRESAEEESLKKGILEKEELERERQEAKKKDEERKRADLEKYQAELAAAKERRANEEKNIIAWETLQRFKRDEYNKEIRLKERNREWRMKMETSNYLRKQMAEREAELYREGLMGNEALQMKANFERTNERALAYGEEVLKECKELNESYPNGPTRPLFPILKAIETFKKESGLIPPKPYEECASPKKRRRKRPNCAKTLRPEEILYL